MPNEPTVAGGFVVRDRSHTQECSQLGRCVGVVGEELSHLGKEVEPGFGQRFRLLCGELHPIAHLRVRGDGGGRVGHEELGKMGAWNKKSTLSINQRGFAVERESAIEHPARRVSPRTRIHGH